MPGGIEESQDKICVRTVDLRVEFEPRASRVRSIGRDVITWSRRLVYHFLKKHSSQQPCLHIPYTVDKIKLQANRCRFEYILLCTVCREYYQTMGRSKIQKH